MTLLELLSGLKGCWGPYYNMHSVGASLERFRAGYALSNNHNALDVNIYWALTVWGMP